jgi:hypothetical protein
MNYLDYNSNSTRKGNATTASWKLVPAPETRQRCPHDGGRCHHRCTGTCSRKAMGASLTTPWPGYPKPGNAPVKESGNG